MIETTRHAVLEGRYVLLECLGSGGTAKVYQASDRLLGREVALKVLREEYAGESRSVQRFRDEARSAASLSHPNIVQIYELGFSEAGIPFFAMEYAEGGALKERLRLHGALEPADAAATAAGIARALQAAHARGVIHRDIKPQNVLLTGSGHIKVADFGIACTPSSTTDARGVHGTVRYMSPEQAAGKATGANSDLYSLGAVFYELLTGEPPFRGETQTAVALKHLNEPPRPPKELNPDVPDDLNDLALRLLAKSSAERPDAGTLLSELEAAVETVTAPESPLVPEPSSVYRAGSRLFAVISERRRGSYSAETRERPSAARATRLKGRRTRRRKFLAAASLALVLAAAGWGLYGEDLRAMYAEATPQEVSSSAEPPPGEEASPARSFLHSAEASNISANSTYLDIPAANSNPDARITITQNWNPGGEDGVYNEHPVGVWYDTAEEQWAIFNQDRATMPEGASFNVVVWSERAGET